MSESRKQSLAILARVAQFLEGLPEEHLADVESGAARITLIPAGSEKPLVPPARTTRSGAKPRTATIDPSTYAQQLKELVDRTAARQLLRPLKKDDLVAVADFLGMAGTRGYTKDQLAEEIVQATVGNRADAEAIRSVDDRFR